MIDLGTGDGLFVEHSARGNPDRLFIGIDANRLPLEKISERIHRKPEVPNALFLQAAIENLPPELDGVAGEVHIRFPWGTLLRAAMGADAAALASLRRLCAPGARLEVLLGVDPERDRSELERLDVQPAGAAGLAPAYEAAGFEVVEIGELEMPEWSSLKSSWARRLRSAGTGRTVTRLIARCRREPSSG